MRHRNPVLAMREGFSRHRHLIFETLGFARPISSSSSSRGVMPEDISTTTDGERDGSSNSVRIRHRQDAMAKTSTQVRLCAQRAELVRVARIVTWSRQVVLFGACDTFGGLHLPTSLPVDYLQRKHPVIYTSEGHQGICLTYISST
jgi:hypothetical protein